MSDLFPRFIADGTRVAIEFHESNVVRTVDVHSVVDLDDFGEVVGIEVLDWSRQLEGGRLEGSSPSHSVRWSYDDEIDAIYFRLSGGRGQAQRSVIAVTGIDVEGLVVRMDVSIESGASAGER
jgi:uncharacterized protein YuzE